MAVEWSDEYLPLVALNLLLLLRSRWRLSTENQTDAKSRAGIVVLRGLAEAFG